MLLIGGAGSPQQSFTEDSAKYWSFQKNEWIMALFEEWKATRLSAMMMHLCPVKTSISNSSANEKQEKEQHKGRETRVITRYDTQSNGELVQELCFHINCLLSALSG